MSASLSNVSNESALSWMQQYQSQKRKCDEENGVLRNIIKSAKADGVNAKSMIAAVIAAKNPEQAQIDLRDQMRYLALRNVPMIQAELFAWNSDIAAGAQAASDLWDSQDRGYQAGREGASLGDNPYAPGTEQHV
jgi:hypothetical protein